MGGATMSRRVDEGAGRGVAQPPNECPHHRASRPRWRESRFADQRRTVRVCRSRCGQSHRRRGVTCVACARSPIHRSCCCSTSRRPRWTTRRSRKSKVGLAQALAAAIVAYTVVLVARGRKIYLEREAAIALGRGLVQIVAVGSVLVLLLNASRWTGALLLAAMMLAAGAT